MVMRAEVEGWACGGGGEFERMWGRGWYGMYSGLYWGVIWKIVILRAKDSYLTGER